MQISVESIGSLGRRVTVAVPAERFESAIADRLRRLSKQVKLPGFRPGKVPLKMVEARYGGQVMEEVAGELIKTTLQEAIGKQGLKPAGGPRIHRKAFTRGKEFEYIAEFEVYPEITRLDLSGISIERPVVAVVEEDVDRTLETIRRQRVTWHPVTREARNDDRLTVDFTGRLDGKEFEGGSATALPLVLGSGTFVEGMEEGLLGVKAGESRRISVTFPADYRNASLAGQPVDFEVSVKEVAEPVLPEVDEDLAKQLGVQDGNLETLRAQVRSNLEREADQRSRAVVRGWVLKALLDANQFELPESLLSAEVERLKQLDRKAAQTAGAAPQGNDEAYRNRARPRVALGLILAEIVRTRGIAPDPARVRARLEKMAEEYESPETFIQWHYANPGRLDGVESLVMEERVVEDLLGTAEVSDKQVGFQELLQMEISTQ